MNVTKQIAALTLAILAIPIQGARSTPLYQGLFGIDDYDQVEAVAPVATEGSFVDTAIKNSGFQTPAWNWTQAPLAVSAAVRGDTTIDPYVAWVVKQPLVTYPNGATRHGGFDDIGGVNVVFQFAPKLGDPLLLISAAAAPNNSGSTQLHWLQVFHQSNNLGLDETLIDNSTPWYDVGGEAGIASLIGSGSWLGDVPKQPENGPNIPDPGAGYPGVEPVNPYYYSVQFETYLAVDKIVNNVNKVTLYGGWAWGFDTLLLMDPSEGPLSPPRSLSSALA